MTNRLLAAASMLLFTLPVGLANASTSNFSFSGPGVSGSVSLTYGAATDSKVTQGYEVTGISGVFSDSNNGLDIVDASIGSLVSVVHSTPDPTNLLAPNDFSRFGVASGLASGESALSYDNLYYPGGSPATASSYPLHGGFLDIYGLLFNIGNGEVVDFWSNGTITGIGPYSYGVAVATSATALDYVGTGVAITPEPGSLVLLAGGLFSLAWWRLAHSKRASRR